MLASGGTFSIAITAPLPQPRRTAGAPGPGSYPTKMGTPAILSRPRLNSCAADAVKTGRVMVGNENAH